MCSELTQLTNIDLLLIAASGLSCLVAGGAALRSMSARTNEATAAAFRGADHSFEQASELHPQLQAPQTQLLVAASNRSEELEKELAAKTVEANDAREEAELLLLQLHKVQEELEHFFILSRDLQGQLEARGAQLPEAVGQITALKQCFGEVIQRQQRRQSRLETLVLQQNSALTRASRMLQRTQAKSAVPLTASRVHEEIAFI